MQPIAGVACFGNRVIAGGAVDHDQRTQPRVLAGLRVEARAELGIGDGNLCAGIGQIELQQLRCGQRVDHQRHEAGAHCAEERRRVNRRVVKEQQDAVAALQSERHEGVAPARRIGAQLAIGPCAGRAGQRQALGVAIAEIVEQDPARIVAFGDRKADLARAGTVLRNLIDDSSHDCPFAASYRAMKAGDIARSRASSIRPERVM